MLQGCVVHEAGLRGHQMHCNGEGCVDGSRRRIRGLHGSRLSEALRMQWLFSISTSMLSLLLVLMERVGLAEGGRVLVLGLRTTWGTVPSWGRALRPRLQPASFSLTRVQRLRSHFYLATPCPTGWLNSMWKITGRLLIAIPVSKSSSVISTPSITTVSPLTAIEGIFIKSKIEEQSLSQTPQD